MEVTRAPSWHRSSGCRGRCCRAAATSSRSTRKSRPCLEAGAAGCMVGRALWGEAARAPDEDRLDVIETVVVPRLERLRSLVVHC